MKTGLSILLVLILLLDGCASFMTHGEGNHLVPTIGSYHGPYSGTYADAQQIIGLHPLGEKTTIGSILFGIIDLAPSIVMDTFFVFADLMNWACGGGQ